MPRISQNASIMQVEMAVVITAALGSFILKFSKLPK